MTISSRIRRTAALAAGAGALSLGTLAAASPAQARAVAPSGTAPHASIHLTTGSLTGAVTPDATGDSYCGIIGNGQEGCAIWDGYELGPGQYITVSISGDPNFVRLEMQTDGNLVLYHNCGGSYHAVWGSGTRTTGHYAAMQGSGNLVVYNSVGHAEWGSPTNGHANAWLAIQGDGNLVIYAAPAVNTSTPLWATNTNYC